MTEKEIFELFDLYGTDMGDYYEIEVGRIERLVKEIEFQSAPRELSDEEIIEIGNAVTNLIDSNEGWIEFARAILKKASEK
jgi:uncharacterized protein YejL (UPF0352 family)